MEILITLKNYLPLFPLLKEDFKLTEDKKDFEALLRSSETEKTHAFILKHPELINQTLHDSQLKPIDLSLSLKKTTNIKFLIENGAEINTPNASGLSFLDNLLLMNNQYLLKDVFGSILGNIFYHIQKETERSQINDYVMPEAFRQLKSIENEIKRYQDLTVFNLSKNDLIEKIKSSSDFVIEKTSFFSTKEIFDAVIYSILTHQNMAVETLYKQFGCDVLRLQTTDFKNLFHIAAIANNFQIIEKFSEWGLSFSSLLTTAKTALNPLSPFHYAIFHPTFDTFIALLKAKVTIPPPANLSYLNRYTKNFKEEIKQLNFNPFQLLVFKANLNDPLPKEDSLSTACLYLEAIQLIISQLLPNEKVLEEYRELLGLIRISFLAANIAKIFTRTNFSNVSSILGVCTAVATFGAALYSTFNTSIFNIIRSFSSYYVPLASTLMIKKVWNDFTSYQNAYLYRPGKTLWTFAKDMFTNFLFVKTTFLDPKIEFEKLFDPQKKSKKFHENPFTSFKRSSTILNPLEKQEAFNKLKDQLKQLHPIDIYNCSIDKDTRFQYILRCLCSNNSIDVKNINCYIFSDEEAEKIIKKGLLPVLHPDKCSNKYSDNNINTICSEIYQKISGMLK